MDPDANRPSSYSATTDFDSVSHEAMLEMIDNADPTAVSDLGDALIDAETKLNDIGGALKRDLHKLHWTSKAGEDFHHWGTDIVKAALGLADYSGRAGVFMLNAGSVLGEVKKAMPKVPTEAKQIATAYDPGGMVDSAGKGGKSGDAGGTTGAFCPTPKAVEDAKTKVEDARLEASRQMIKLGQAYNMSTDIISSEPPPPEFPPTPPGLMPERPRVEESVNYGGTPDSGAPTPYSGGSPGVFGSPAPAVAAVSPHAAASDGSSNHAAPPVGTHIDSLATAPPRHDVGRVTPDPIAPAPGPDGAAKPTVLPPGTTFGPPPAVPPGRMAPPGITGGGPVPRLPAGGTGGTGLPRPPATNGIYGGRPITSTGPVNQIPRSTVVGNEQRAASHMMRPPMAGGHGGTAVGGTGGSSPFTGGRRLASEPGGMVGGPRHPGGSGGEAFTRGGSGLARHGEGASHPTGGTATGAARGALPPAHEEPRSRRGQRPDYLNEDEETWDSGNRNVLPPVID